MNGCHVWIDTDISGNSCYLTECESLVSQFFVAFLVTEKQALTGMLRHVLKIMALRVHEYVLGINESHFFRL